MPTYVYETIPENGTRQARRFEIRQRMSDDALVEDPETGEPVRRVITGGMGIMSGKAGAASPGGSDFPAGGGGCCGGACGCG